MGQNSSERKPLLPKIHGRRGSQDPESPSPTGSHTYGRALPELMRDNDDDLATASKRAAWKIPAALIFLGLFMMLFVLFDIGLEQRKRKAAPPLGLPIKVQKRWGQYSPYLPAGKYKPPPSSCVINQVNIVSLFFVCVFIIFLHPSILTNPQRPSCTCNKAFREVFTTDTAYSSNATVRDTQITMMTTTRQWIA